MIDAFSIEHGMEQTSMTNAIKKRLDRKGFTLAEVLVTVAIILILAGVTFVSVAQYQKNLRLMEMDGTAKEIFIAAQNHLSVAQASGDLDRLAEKAKSANSTTASPIGTKLLPAPSYAGNADGEYYYVIHNVTSSSESCTPSGSDTILGMMLPFGALDETVATGGNYAIVYELKSASVVAVLYSGAGNASFGNAAVINLEDADVNAIPTLYKDKSARKSYQKDGVTAIVGCYTGIAGSAAIPTETLEAPKLEVKNENKLHVIVSGNYSAKDVITLTIHGVQSDTTAIMQLNCKDSGGNTFDVTLDDVTVNYSTRKDMRFAGILGNGRFTRSDATPGKAFIPGENIEVSATARATDALSTPKTSAVYTTSSLFADANDGRTVYIKNLRHLENLSVDISGFKGDLKDKSGSTDGSIHAIQKNDITMIPYSGLNGFVDSSNSLYIYGSGTSADMYIAANVSYPLSYDGGSHEIYDLSIAPYSGGSVKELNAGIFGNVTSTLSVKNLILRNDKIRDAANATNAGMLLGKASADLTVDGVLAYYHEDTYDETKDSSVEVTARQNAGGLIGLVSGGKLDVKNVAAAVYVKGGSAAGGLIGSVDGADAGSTIVQSYVGGHTRDGAYSTTDATTNKPVLDGPGRYNVQAIQASGYAGGFIGVTTDHVTMNAVYSTASAYASSGDANSNAFAGSGTPKIKTTADGKKNYYAIGTHNGKDADGEDIEKAQLSAGEKRHQATAYDRTLMGATETTAHPAMDKTSYLLNTIRHLCATNVDDKELPWFIREHVGDWALQKASESKFEVDNGNRLTVRIDTGMNKIAGDLYYEIKVHGVSSNKDKYFLLHVKNNAGDFTLVRANSIIKTTFDSNMQQQNICKIVPAKKRNETEIQTIEFYLDDITNPKGNFKSVCEGLIPGENIKISVAPAKVTGNSVSVEFDDKTAIETNSLFGYLKPSDESDEHNINKITAVKSYYSDAGNSGLGLVPYNNILYAQIDNARHLENLSPEISGYTYEIKGAIQTDNIYWSYESNPSLETGPDSYTKIFTKELGSNLSVYDQDGNKHNNAEGCFRPLNSNAIIELYSAWNAKDNRNYKLSGIRVNEESGAAGIFAQTPVAITIQNLDVENGSFTSKADKAGGLIACGENTVTFNSVNFTGDLIVKGQNIAGGFVAQSKGSLNITKSSINNASICSLEDKAGGLAGCADNDVTISEMDIVGPLTVEAKNIAGGFVAQPKGSLNITKSSINNANIRSVTDKAGGLVGYTDNDVTISEMNIVGPLTVEAKNIAGGFVAQPKESLTVTKSSIKDASICSLEDKAGGIIGVTGTSATLNNITTDSLSVAGKSGAGGLIAKAESTVTITCAKVIGKNAAIFAEQDAGGLIGSYTSQLDVSNSAVSAFVESSEGNAGGLIGTVPENTATCIEKSYYGGRTVAGAYGTYTFNAGTGNDKVYEANISGGANAGGLIGSIGDNPNLKVNYCFSTGSVKTKNGSVGGFVGSIGNINSNNMSLDHCYSMGKVLSVSNDSGATEKIGGFIGQISKAEPKCTSVFYLNAFNLSSINPVGSSKKSSITKITNASEILGKVESSDLTSAENTKNYDDTLNDQAYPYKNWTKSGENANDPIEYYGDWPLPNKQLNGRIVYYHRISGDNTEGEFTLTGYDTSLTTKLRNLKGNFENDGFAIICETPKRNDAHRKYMYADKPHDPNDINKHDGYIAMTVEGSDNNVECAPFVWEDKTYYFFRFTNITLPETGIMTVYFRGNVDTIYSSIIYKADINVATHTATFTRIE